MSQMKLTWPIVHIEAYARMKVDREQLREALG